MKAEDQFLHIVSPSEIEDCTQDWTFTENSFDYVYMRYLVGCIPDWTEQFKQAFKVLKPGGYLESFEASPRIESDDGTVAPGSPLNRWGDIFLKAGEKSGRSFTVIEEGLQRKSMEEAGFVDLQEWNFKVSLLVANNSFYVMLTMVYSVL
jgi:ubiquinone/menaquinone biosynthesis C-methylase UbiE